uniref:Uncharacterized protein n=1 Tax=Glossina austeni TaxID=7395 RepID=A0A1A9UJV5_GLOAU
MKAFTYLSSSYHFGQIDSWYFQQMRFNGGQFFAAHFDVGEAAIGYNEPTEHDHGRTQKAPHYVPRYSGTKSISVVWVKLSATLELIDDVCTSKCTREKTHIHVHR